MQNGRKPRGSVKRKKKRQRSRCSGAISSITAAQEAVLSFSVKSQKPKVPVPRGAELGSERPRSASAPPPCAHAHTLAHTRPHP